MSGFVSKRLRALLSGGNASRPDERATPAGDTKTDFESLTRDCAADIVDALYRSLLNREPDASGLEHHADYLRNGGQLRGAIERLISSDEFLGIAEERAVFHSKALAATLPPPAQRITIFTNCQGSNLSRCIQAMTGTQPPEFQFIRGLDVLEPHRLIPKVRDALAVSDLILMQPLYVDVVLAGLPEAAGKILQFPSIAFPAYQPDQCYVRIQGTVDEVTGPLGPYHSSIAYYAWRAGLSADQTERLFCDAVYEHLRFHDYWDASRQALLEEGRRTGMPLEAYLNRWRARGCFMHSPSHPKLFVIADIAREIMKKLGLTPLPIDPLEVVWDNLADVAIWPVYPEIGRRMGVEGSYVFKGNNPGLPSKAPIVVFGLRDFIERSFAAFVEASQKHEIYCNRPYTARYRELFDDPERFLQAGKSAVAMPAAVRGSGENPYAALDSRAFWRQGVAEVPAAEVDPVSDTSLVIDRSTVVVTAGSCFAQHISRRLRQAGFNYLIEEIAPPDCSAAEAASRGFGVYSARYGNVYTARQLLQLFDRAHGDFVPQDQAWARSDGTLVDVFRPEIEKKGFASIDALLDARSAHLAAVRALFAKAELFVFTLGLTEAWRAKADGAVFPVAPGVAAGAMDASRYEFVNFSHDEILADLRAFADRLFAINPRVRLLLTVSPVPLVATYSGAHVLSATTYSKSVLRAAAGALAAERDRCHYFPAYEVVTGGFNRGGYFERDLRSVNAAGVDHVMRLFFAHHTRGAADATADPELLQEAIDHYRIVCEEELLAR